MVVALCTSQRQTHRNSSGCIHAISNVSSLILFRNRSAFKVDWMVAIKPCSYELICRRIRKKVTCKLLSQEPVVWHVAVECTDNPVSPAEHISVTIDVIPMGVRVACQVKPHQCHSLTVSRPLKQSVNNPLICTWFRVSCIGFDVIDAWWQTRQVKSYPPKKSQFICCGQRL